MKTVVYSVLLSFLILNCGVKGPPLPPIQGEMKLESGEIEKDKTEENQKKKNQ